jgi:hypothetical protein
MLVNAHQEKSFIIRIQPTFITMNVPLALLVQRLMAAVLGAGMRRRRRRRRPRRIVALVLQVSPETVRSATRQHTSPPPDLMHAQLAR